MSALAADPPRLDLAALAIATLANPTLDAPACLHTLDALAARVQVEVERHMEEGPSLARLRALRHVLADIEGFRGNEHALLRAGEQLPGPGAGAQGGAAHHALGGVPGGGRGGRGSPCTGWPSPATSWWRATRADHKLVMDPFHNGDILTETGCEELLKRVAPQLRFDRGQAARPRRWSSSPTGCCPTSSACTWSTRTPSGGWRWWTCCCCWRRTTRASCARARLLLTKVGAFRAALKDVERCLELSPEAPDRERLELMAKELRERLANLN